MLWRICFPTKKLQKERIIVMIPSLRKLNQKLKIGVGEEGSIRRDLMYTIPLSFGLV